ncbi:MAG: HD domain-containing phosphohydrolase [Candidatus Aminicenantia bacterium]
MNVKEEISLLIKKIRRENKTLKTLLRVTRSLSFSLEIEDVLYKAMKHVEKVCKAEASSIWEIDYDKKELFFRVIRGEHAGRIKAKRLKIGEGIAGYVAKTKKPLMVSNVRENPYWEKTFDTESSFQSRSILAVPLLISKRVVGVIELLNKIGRNGFTLKDKENILALSGAIAIALENARLYEEKKDLFIQTSFALATAIEKRDPYTGGHTKRVLDYSLMIGKSIGLSGNELEGLKISSILHDIGKIGIPDSILAKPTSLNPEEFKIIKAHPVIGAEILCGIDGMEKIVNAIKHHHERWDGKGYPEKLSGEDIPLWARIIAVADTFDALTTLRPYRDPIGFEEALKRIEENTSKQFCPFVTSAFLKIMRG